MQTDEVNARLIVTTVTVTLERTCCSQSHFTYISVAASVLSCSRWRIISTELGERYEFFLRTNDAILKETCVHYISYFLKTVSGHGKLGQVVLSGVYVVCEFYVTSHKT